jgi:hypothetical protein
MPIPIQTSSGIEQAVNSMLRKSGVLTNKEKLSESLISNGLTIDELGAQIANLVFSGKERTRLEALKLALAGHGIDLREQTQVNVVPSITFNIVSNSETNVLEMFAPTREIKSLKEMSLPNV